MAYSPEIAQFYSVISGTLETLLPDCVRTLTGSADRYPLLIAETRDDSIGFSFIIDKPEESFRAAYEAFKDHYRQHHGTWKKRTLSFVVFNLEKHALEHETFFGSIEMDAYFCRKYVLRFYRSPESLAKELNRLPFIPLPLGQPGGIARPPTAQSLLQNFGVSAALARRIVALGHSSARTILESTTSPSQGLPEIRDSESEGHYDVQQIPVTERTRIKKLSIEAFRAYKQRQEFDLDADIVVFYGPNGLGKTSLFDALDYVCTGRIGRLCTNKKISSEDFISLARHLDPTANKGVVSLDAYQNDKGFSITREVDDWGYAIVNSEKYDRTGVLELLTSADWGNSRTRIENLEKLFRATHLFSQASPEMFTEFHTRSELSAELVSRALALDDYTSGLNKTREVLTLIKEESMVKAQELADINLQLDELKKEMSSIPSLEPRSENNTGQQLSEQLSEHAATLMIELRSSIGFIVGNSDFNVDSSRQWRALVSSERKDLLDRVSRFKSLESKLQGYLKNKTLLKAINDRLAAAEKSLKETTEQHNALLAEQQKETSAHSQAKDALSKVQKTQQSIIDLTTLAHPIQDQEASSKKWLDEKSRAERELAAITQQLSVLHSNKEQLVVKIQEEETQSTVKSERIELLLSISEKIESWIKAKVEVARLEKVRQDLQSDIEKANSALTAHRNTLAAQSQELQSKERDYERLTEHQSDLIRLLDEIEGHVSDGICPTCGVDHKTKNDLIQRIHSQKGTRPKHIDELQVRRQELHTAIEQSNAQIDSIAWELGMTEEYLATAGEQIEAQQSIIRDFIDLVNTAGVSVDTHDLVSAVKALITKEQQDQQMIRESLEKHLSELSAVDAAVGALEAKKDKENQLQKLASDSLDASEKQKQTLQLKSDALKRSIDLRLNDLNQETEALKKQEQELSAKIESILKKRNALTAQINDKESIINTSKVSINSIKKEKDSIESELRSYEAQATGIKPDDLTPDFIGEEWKQASEKAEKLEGLERRMLIIERSFDAAQRSAMLAELELRSSTLSKTKDEIQRRKQELNAQDKWFKTIEALLEKKNSSAVINHVNAFGPLSTIIQRRLRSAYGFGDITLLPKGQSIRVEVSWQDKKVKPPDYFSDSQKQIMMLSIFLSGRLTQTWSGFAPILLDDPVTHFDDLNAFGFVELIRGLSASAPGKRQFLISTCEKRLFDLMQSKFSNIQGGAKFYCFESIGANGPVVSKLEV